MQSRSGILSKVIEASGFGNQTGSNGIYGYKVSLFKFFARFRLCPKQPCGGDLPPISAAKLGATVPILLPRYVLSCFRYAAKDAVRLYQRPELAHETGHSMSRILDM